MEIRSMHFVERVRQRLDDDELQRNLKRTRGRNAASRAAAASTSSSALVGTQETRLTAPGWWPLRPAR